MDSALKTSSRDDWLTPRNFFAKLHDEFDFDLDAAARDEASATIPTNFITPEEDALVVDWSSRVPKRGAVWLNHLMGAGYGSGWRRLSASRKRGSPSSSSSLLVPIPRGGMGMRCRLTRSDWSRDGSSSSTRTRAKLTTGLRCQALSLCFATTATDLLGSSP